MNYEDFDQDLIEDLLAIMQEYKDNNVLKIKPIHLANRLFPSLPIQLKTLAFFALTV